MLPPLELVEKQASRTEHHIMLYMLKEMQETNRLLRQMIVEKSESAEVSDLKRPQLMQLMSQRKDAPQGWNKWSNEQIIKHLKGAS